MRFLSAGRPGELETAFRSIGVDPYGIRLMAPKARGLVLRIDDLPTIAANVLKQEMLSFGGDAAVARYALTGAKKRTPCILIGTETQFARLIEKLALQPFGLAGIAAGIRTAMENAARRRFTVPFGRRSLVCGPRTLIMGIVNATPDSFSGDGLLTASRRRTSAVDGDNLMNAAGYAQRLVRDGADIIDIGAESTRPGARPVPAAEQARRAIPLIRALARTVNVPISIDTRSAEVAERALDAGADIINDVSGLRDPRMRRLAARRKAPVVLMHMRGSPVSMQRAPKYDDVVGDVLKALDHAVETALTAGIAAERIIVDPGICFGKTRDHNIALLRHLKEFSVLGKPILVGPSRKSFIGNITGAAPGDRLAGTIAACAAAARQGAHIVRVHDVKAVKQALAVTDAIAGKGE